MDFEPDLNELDVNTEPSGAATDAAGLEGGGMLDVAGILDEGPRQSVGREAFPERSANPLRHFSLTTQPFADNVNPDYFFRTEAHEEAFLAMKRCIEEHISLGLTTAISGTGKTLLTQVLIHELDPRQYQPILVLAYPGMSRSALLREIAGELKLEDVPPRANMHTLVTAIQAYIIQLYLKGIRLVLIIDEVHFLGADSLHILRTLSNIEVPERKLVTVLLFGEQIFLKKLEHPNFKSVFSRMFSRVELRPLHATEVPQYVKFRWLMAGGRPAVFGDEVFDRLHALTGGIPREINRLCHNVVAHAARRGEERITADLLDQLAQNGRI